MKQFALLLVALFFAIMGKFIGQFVAKTHFTDDTSAVLTVASHRAAFKKIGLIAICALGVSLIMLFIGGLVAKWIQWVGWIPLMALNACLALLAGTAGSLASLLGRAHRYYEIQRLIDQKKRLIEFLKRFLVVVVVATVLFTMPASAGGAIAFAVDPTVSVNAADRAEGVAFLLKSAGDAIDLFNCDQVVTITIGCDVRHARRTWIDAPRSVPAADCSKAEPAPLTGHSKLWNRVGPVRRARKDEAVQACQEQQSLEQQKWLVSRQVFLESLKQSLAVDQQPECSRITALVANLLESGQYRLIVIVTDALDNPPASPNTLVVRPDVQVVLILARPNPGYGRVEDGLARAAQWARVPGVTVLTTAELRPDVWRTLAGRSPR